MIIILQRIKIHQRAKQRGAWVTDNNDYPESAKRYLEATAKICLEKTKLMGPYVYQLLEKLLEKPSQGKLRKSLALLRLADDYSEERLNNPCHCAIAYSRTHEW